VRSWLTIAIVAGCSHPRGVGIVVTVPDPTSSVELFVGNGTVTDPGSCIAGSACRIGPPATNGSGSYFYGSGWSMSATIADYDDRVEGDTVHFRIEPPVSGAVSVPALLLVGYNGGSIVADRVLHDVEISDRDVEIETTLLPVTGGLDTSDGERALVWRKPSDSGFKLSACAAVAHGDGTTEFFSPNDDHDCDGAILGDPRMAECNMASSFNWCGVEPRGISEADCVTYNTMNGVTSCRLAGPACTDNGPMCSPKANACTPTSPVACLPPEVCHGAMQMMCTAFDSTCVGAITGSTQPLPRITCPLGVYAGAICPASLDVSKLQLGPVLLNRTCSMLALMTISTPVQFGPSVTVGTTAISLLPNPIAAGPCVVDVHSTASLNSLGDLVLDIQTGLEHRLIPLGITYTTTSACAMPYPPCFVDTPPSTYVCP
jgi:hypothetical protein